MLQHGAMVFKQVGGLRQIYPFGCTCNKRVQEAKIIIYHHPRCEL
jgi:hypothetical protein